MTRHETSIRSFALSLFVLFALAGCDKKTESTEEKASSEESKPEKKKASDDESKKKADEPKKADDEGDKPAAKTGMVGTDDAGNKKVVTGAASVSNGPSGPAVKAGDVKLENGKVKVPGLPTLGK